MFPVLYAFQHMHGLIRLGFPVHSAPEPLTYLRGTQLKASHLHISAPFHRATPGPCKIVCC